jgi:fructose-bisphosphate aldolase, class I
MGLGATVRLSRLFSHPSGNLFGAALDHFIGYGDVRAGGLADLPAALEKVMARPPDSVTLLPGSARSLWAPYAGRAALIVQAGLFTVDDRVCELVATPEDALRLGADAIAVAIPVRGKTEGSYLRWLTDTVRAAAVLEIPVIAHIYPREFRDGTPRIVFDADQIAWAVRCGIETGVDVIKVGYPDDQAAFAELVRSCPVPVVLAGGPRAATFEAALRQVAEGMAAGARGAVIGRNLWGQTDVAGSARSYAGIIHDGATVEEAAEHVVAPAP